MIKVTIYIERRGFKIYQIFNYLRTIECNFTVFNNFLFFLSEPSPKIEQGTK